MTKNDAVALVMVRHGPTDWNEQGRIQGRSDRSLSEAGRASVEAWQLPTDLVGYDWVTSPLRRAIETAEALGHPEATRNGALMEMHWGAWEGWTLALLRERDDAAMVQNEARGLDFRPSGGESPRDVQARLRPWLARRAETGRPTVAVTHKGVIRALYAMASGWDMTGKPPQKLRNASAHRFLVDPAGEPRVDCLNIALQP